MLQDECSDISVMFMQRCINRLFFFPYCNEITEKVNLSVLCYLYVCKLKLCLMMPVTGERVSLHKNNSAATNTIDCVSSQSIGVSFSFTS